MHHAIDSEQIFYQLSMSLNLSTPYEFELISLNFAFDFLNFAFVIFSSILLSCRRVFFTFAGN